MKKEYILSIGFLIIVFVIGAINLKNMMPILRESEVNFSKEEGGKQIEETYRLEFVERREWVNLYGTIQKGLNRRLIGNMDFIKTKNGLMDHVTKESDVKPFAHELVELNNELEQRDIPLLYVQMPTRTGEELKEPETLVRTQTYYEEIRAITDKEGIACMDENQMMQGKGAPSIEEFYFKTDVHPTTEGEVWTAKKLIEALNQRFQIPMQPIAVEDEAQFDKHHHPFLGNFAQSVGVYYNGVDEFVEYIPKSKSQYKVTDILGNWENTGSFEEMLMNGYDTNIKDETYTYWVTNYLKYGAYGYNIENVDMDGSNLLVICDSLCYRTLSYLSLVSSNITVLDPRFYSDTGENLVQKALETYDYDVAIYLHGTFYTTDHSMFGRGLIDK